MPKFLLQSPQEVEPVHWQHEVAGSLPIDISTTIISNNNLLQEDPESPAVIVFPGYGEGNWAAKRGLKTLARLGIQAHAAIINADDVPAESVHIESFMRNVGAEVTDDLQERGALKSDSVGIGHSLGGITLGLAINRGSELGGLGFLEPVGHSNLHLKELYPDDVERQAVFTKRFGRVIVGPYAEFPYRLVRAGHNLASQIGRDLLPPSERRFQAQFGVVVSESMDTTPSVIQHAQRGNKIVHILGQKDPLIKPAEVSASLRAHSDNLGVDSNSVTSIIVTDNTHAYMGFRAGAEHLTIAAQELGLISAA